MKIGSIEQGAYHTLYTWADDSHAVPVHFLMLTHDVKRDTLNVLNFVLFNNSLLTSEHITQPLFDEIVTVAGDFC